MDSDQSAENSDDEDFVLEKEKSKKAIKKNDSTKKVVKKITTKKKPEDPKSPKRKQPAKKKKEATAGSNEETEEKKEDQVKEKNANLGKNLKKNTISNARDEGTNVVLEYMRKQNRPYSLINILDNLHGEIKKAQGQKILDQLSEEGELQMKEYGKARIYLINQKNVPEADKTEMEELKISLEKCKIEHNSLSNEIKTLKKKEIELNNQLTNEELETEIEKYEGQVTDLELRIVFYQSDEYQKLPDSVINEAENQKVKMEKEYKKRKRMCMDIISQLAENMDKKVKEVEEMVGIEKD